MSTRVLSTWRDNASGMRLDLMEDGRYIIENGAGYELTLTDREWLGLRTLLLRWLVTESEGQS